MNKAEFLNVMQNGQTIKGGSDAHKFMHELSSSFSAFLYRLRHKHDYREKRFYKFRVLFSRSGRDQNRRRRTDRAPGGHSHA